MKFHWCEIIYRTFVKARNETRFVTLIIVCAMCIRGEIIIQFYRRARSDELFLKQEESV